MQIGISKETYASSGYRLCCITKNYQHSRCINQWRKLLAESRSCEKIYQSPEFFNYLVASQHCRSDRFELFSVDDEKEGIVGILPLRMSFTNLDVRVGSFVIYSYRVSVIRLLGSFPMLKERDALLNEIMYDLLGRFPDQGAIMLQSCPIEEKEILRPNSMVNFSVLYGWRTCHTIPVPDQFEAYLQQLSAKKRYNTSREIRLLKKAVGELCLKRIDGPSDVAELFDCLTVIAPGPKPGTLDENDYTVFAENNICLSYTLSGGGEWIAAVIGSRFGETWHVHRIHFSPKYRQLSAGSVAMHLAIKDVIQNFNFTKIDFGFGTPTYKFASTHVLKKRATILVTRRYSRLNLMISLFVAYDKFHSRLAGWAIAASEMVWFRIRRIAVGLQKLS
jgi:hypothetical protein